MKLHNLLLMVLILLVVGFIFNQMNQPDEVVFVTPVVAPTPTTDVVVLPTGDVPKGAIGAGIALSVLQALGLNKEEAQIEIPKSQHIQKAANAAIARFVEVMNEKPASSTPAKSVEVSVPPEISQVVGVAPELETKASPPPEKQLSAGETAYNSAFHACAKNGHGLLVLVGASWCPPCQTTKANLHELETAGQLADVEFVYLDVDECREFAEKNFLKGQQVPLLCYYKQGQGGVFHNGLQSKAELTELLHPTAVIEPEKPASTNYNNYGRRSWRY